MRIVAISSLAIPLALALVAGCGSSDATPAASSSSSGLACTIPITILPGTPNSVSTKECQILPGATPDICSAMLGTTSKTCPTDGLVGCCDSPSDGDAGVTEHLVTCYYYDPGPHACDAPSAWSTTPPP